MQNNNYLTTASTDSITTKYLYKIDIDERDNSNSKSLPNLVNKDVYLVSRNIQNQASNVNLRDRCNSLPNLIQKENLNFDKIIKPVILPELNNELNNAFTFVELNKVFNYCIEQFLLKPFTNQTINIYDIPRRTHGVMHAVRTALWIPLLLSNLRLDPNPTEEILTAKEIQALMLTALLHDSGREGDSIDKPEWEKKSADNCEIILSTCGFDEIIIKRCKQAIIEKESSKDLFALLLHDADTIEIGRICKKFNNCYIKLPIKNFIYVEIFNIINNQGDMQYNLSNDHQYDKSYLFTQNYSIPKKRQFELSENPLIFALNSIEMLSKTVHLSILESASFINNYKSISCEMKIIKNVNLFSKPRIAENLKLNYLLESSLTFIKEYYSKLMENITKLTINELHFKTMIKIKLLYFDFLETEEKLNYIIYSKNQNFDKILFMMDFIEIYYDIYIMLNIYSSSKIEEYLNSLSKWDLRQHTYKILLYFQRYLSLINNTEISLKNNKISRQYIFNTMETLESRHYDKHVNFSNLTQDVSGLHVLIERIDVLCFKSNRNMNHDHCSPYSLKNWDRISYHGTQSTNFLKADVKIELKDPQVSNPLASGRETGFYTDIDPFGTPILVATSDLDNPSFLVEVEALGDKWKTLESFSPSWICFTDSSPDNLCINKVYELSRRVKICAKVFSEVL